MTLRRSAVCLLLLAACDPGDVVLLAPEKTTGDVPALTIHAVIDTPYATVATGLGWSGGVPNGFVRVHRMDDPYDDAHWITTTADSTGLAVFTGLLRGLYEVAVRRVLAPEERAPRGDATNLLAGGRRVYVSPGAAQAVTMAPDRPGSLVFSEFALTEPSHWETGGVEYPDAKYFELYNNSDSTIYLDGKYWGVGWDLNRDYRSWPCAETEPVRNDSLGIWAARVFRFPGSGAEYAVAPGQSALIAKGALDHRSVHPGLYDLSAADFEWGGNADNPDVPNLQDIGLRPMVVNWPLFEQPLFPANPVDLTNLPGYTNPVSGSRWVRLPSSAILDVWVGAEDWTTTSYEPESPCQEATHRYFERLPGPAFAQSDFDRQMTVQRRILTVLPDGRKVLQDTDTSMEDFVKAVRTPGWIPDSLGH